MVDFSHLFDVNFDEKMLAKACYIASNQELILQLISSLLFPEETLTFTQFSPPSFQVVRQ